MILKLSEVPQLRFFPWTTSSLDGFFDSLDKFKTLVQEIDVQNLDEAVVQDVMETFDESLALLNQDEENKNSELKNSDQALLETIKKLKTGIHNIRGIVDAACTNIALLDIRLEKGNRKGVEDILKQLPIQINAIQSERGVFLSQFVRQDIKLNELPELQQYKDAAEILDNIFNMTRELIQIVQNFNRNEIDQTKIKILEQKEQHIVSVFHDNRDCRHQLNIDGTNGNKSAQKLAETFHNIGSTLCGVVGSFSIIKLSPSGLQREYSYFAAALHKIYNEKSMLLQLLDRMEMDAENHTTNVQEFLQGLKSICRGQKVNIEIDPKIASQVAFPAYAAGSVLLNFISNAKKYGGSEDGKVRICLIAESAGENRLRFAVQDAGPGIDPEFQTTIFEYGYRIPGETAQGTGIGLASVKDIAKRIGGECGVISTPCKGATFWLEMPATPVLALRPESAKVNFPIP